MTRMSTVKTAVSLDADLFEEVEAFAKEKSLPRSRVVSQALRAFFDRQSHRRLLEQINAACEGEPDPNDEAFRRAALYHTMRRLQEGEQ